MPTDCKKYLSNMTNMISLIFPPLFLDLIVNDLKQPNVKKRPEYIINRDLHTSYRNEIVVFHNPCQCGLLGNKPIYQIYNLYYRVLVWQSARRKLHNLGGFHLYHRVCAAIALWLEIRSYPHGANCTSDNYHRATRCIKSSPTNLTVKLDIREIQLMHSYTHDRTVCAIVLD